MLLLEHGGRSMGQVEWDLLGWLHEVLLGGELIILEVRCGLGREIDRELRSVLGWGRKNFRWALFIVGSGFN